MDILDILDSHQNARQRVSDMRTRFADELLYPIKKARVKKFWANMPPEQKEHVRQTQPEQYEQMEAKYGNQE